MSAAVPQSLAVFALASLMKKMYTSAVNTAHGPADICTIPHCDSLKGSGEFFDWGGITYVHVRATCTCVRMALSCESSTRLSVFPAETQRVWQQLLVAD